MLRGERRRKKQKTKKVIYVGKFYVLKFKFQASAKTYWQIKKLLAAVLLLARICFYETVMENLENVKNGWESSSKF